MKATSFEDLRIWQSARELSKEIYRISRFPEFSKDYRFVGQITSAMGSVMDNIAEGFESGSDAAFCCAVRVEGYGVECRCNLCKW